MKDQCQTETTSSEDVPSGEILSAITHFQPCHLRQENIDFHGESKLQTEDSCSGYTQARSPRQLSQLDSNIGKGGIDNDSECRIPRSPTSLSQSKTIPTSAPLDGASGIPNSKTPSLSISINPPSLSDVMQNWVSNDGVLNAANEFHKNFNSSPDALEDAPHQTLVFQKSSGKLSDYNETVLLQTHLNSLHPPHAAVTDVVPGKVDEFQADSAKQSIHDGADFIEVQTSIPHQQDGPVKKTVLNSDQLEGHEPEGFQIEDALATKKAPKRKPRTYSQAVPSQHCHICSRRPTASSPHVVCGNLQKGRCRKTICTKCFHQFRWDLKAAREAAPGSWKCPHCRGECPQRAQCVIYNRTSDRRRLKLINHRKRKNDDANDKFKDVGAKKRGGLVCADSPNSGTTSASAAPRVSTTIGIGFGGIARTYGPGGKWTSRFPSELAHCGPSRGDNITAAGSGDGCLSDDLRVECYMDSMRGGLKSKDEAMFDDALEKQQLDRQECDDLTNGELMLGSDMIPIDIEEECFIGDESKAAITVDAATGMVTNTVDIEGKTSETAIGLATGLGYFLDDLQSGRGNNNDNCTENSAEEDFGLEKSEIRSESVQFGELL